MSDMVRCSCGLIVANDKLDMHFQSVHALKIISDILKGKHKNDTKKIGAKTEMQPEQVLRLKPQPVYIQYQ